MGDLAHCNKEQAGTHHCTPLHTTAHHCTASYAHLPAFCDHFIDRFWIKALLDPRNGVGSDELINALR